MDALVKEAPQSRAVLDHLAGLVEDMRRGNEVALEALYEATVAKLYALASAIVLARLGNLAEGADVASSTRSGVLRADRQGCRFQRRHLNSTTVVSFVMPGGWIRIWLMQ